MSDVQEQEQTSSSPENQEEGKEFVELSPEQQARFNRIYGHSKQWERIAEDLAKEKKELWDRIEKLESFQTERDTNDRLTKLRAAEKEAMEAGEYDRAGEIRDQITDAKVDAKVPKEKPPEKQESAEEQWLTPERAQRIETWAGEKDEKGELLRPWADPSHDDHQTALTTIQVLVNKNPGIELDELLEKADKVLGKVTKRTSAAVLSSGSDVRPREKKTSLTADEKLVARKMYSALSAKEAEERYAKAKARLS